ncbi:extracellular solute-binding protein [Paenibacillus tarimensis]
MRKKKASLILSAVTAIALLAGCGSNTATNTPDNTTGSSGNNSGQTNTSTETDTPKAPFKISIMANLHTPEVPDQGIEKMIEEATNTELDIQWVPDGSYDEKMNASFATGTLPQVVYVKNQASLINLRGAIRNGQFWEIGPLLGDYPNLSNLNAEVLKNTSVDGKIYALYQERPLSRQGLIYRKDWAEKLGLKEPTNTQELFDMLKAFTEGDPDGNNKNDTIGLTDRSDLIYGAFKTISSWFGTPNNWGMQDGKLMPEFMFPEYIETMDYMKSIHKAGYMNQDFPVTSKTDQQNLLITGKAGAYIGSMGDVQGLHQKLTEVNPDGVLDVQNKITGPDGEFGIWAIPGYGSVALFPKSAVKTEEELKSILAFYDQLMGTELGNLIHWGVEGKHHNLVDGKAEVVDDRQLTDRELKPYQALEIGGELTIEGYLQPMFTLEAKEKAERLTKENNDYLIHDPTAALDSETYALDGPRLQELIKDATYQYMLGNLDQNGFQAAVDNWLKQGGQKIIDEYNASYAAVQ